MSIIGKIKRQLSQKNKRLLQRILFGVRYGGFDFYPEDGYAVLKKKMNRYYKFFPKNKKNIQQELDYINTLPDSAQGYEYAFPYPFVKKYKQDDVQVFKDETNQLYYVMHKGKKLYYSRKYDSISKVQYAYNAISIEQDIDSPHRYLTDTFDVREGDVVIDLGVAEGNFSLENIEKAKKIFLFECSKDWMEALHATFAPWKDKVHIINKYVSDYNDAHTITLQEAVKGEKIDFIKIDVDGVEMKVLNSSKSIINSSRNLKMAICTYHRNGDYENIKAILHSFGFSCTATNGYIVLVFSALFPPYFRKGLIRAIKSY